MAQPTGDRAPTVVIVDVPRSALRGRLAEAMAIYVTAMGYPPSSGPQRGTHMLRHAGFDSFRCRAALDADGRMLGFGYGYTSMPGQWWHDLVLRAIPAGAQEWLGYAFELSELHVTPPAQGAGLGERLLRSLADGLPHRTMVLSTPEGENRAWRLYRRLGFEDLARDHLFPGDHRPFGVLGARLPFPPGPERAAREPRRAG
ncbi:GNAT family N-acetyltransferase [Jatrophihabitans sp.]|uniref:GNAT family N-acetyltransferase n=1 Tax=Jatrophihabitans sp. TaxID=1932789 RepID=UPI002CE43075|nr:GNAT family N-acetyltransferase [Jatrophihabitans sp.]